jgi:hypothetical protein
LKAPSSWTPTSTTTNFNNQLTNVVREFTAPACATVVLHVALNGVANVFVNGRMLLCIVADTTNPQCRYLQSSRDDDEEDIAVDSAIIVPRFVLNKSGTQVIQLIIV